MMNAPMMRGYNRPEDPNKPYKIQSIFPSVLYSAKRETPLSPEEKEDIDNIELTFTNSYAHKAGISINSHIFTTNEPLAILKEFCEQHIRIYVNEIIKPKYKLDFYITQSWINKTEVGGHHGRHAHPNSIISGIFCVHSVEEDKIFFYDPHFAFKNPIDIEEGEFTPWNSDLWAFPVADNDLFLFPSWLEHAVHENEKATTARISLAFNVHAKGMFGDTDRKNELFI